MNHLTIRNVKKSLIEALDNVIEESNKSYIAKNERRKKIEWWL